MAQVQITDLPQALPLTGSESVPIVQNGVTVQTTTGSISGAGALNYPFLTVGSTAGLGQARYLSTGSGLSLTDNGAGSTLQVNLTGAAQSLDSSGTGIQVKTGPNTLTAREITVGAGLGITNGDGVAGNPNIALGSFLQQLVSLTGTGILALQSGTPAKISILGVTNQISITNGDGASDVTVGMASNPVIPGNAGMTIPIGTTAQRPTPSNGIIRYNSSSFTFEGYSNGSWRDFSLSGGVTEIDTGTGLTGGPITSIGTISIANTGVAAGTYGSATLIPQITVNAQGQLTSVTEYSVIGGVSSVSGTANEISASPTTGAVVVSLPTALTFTGKTVTGGTFNMTAATVGSDTVTTNTASQTLTNKTISGASNTLSNIGNSSLTNSSITLGTTPIALGATSLAPVGLTSVTVTQDPTTALQLATKQYVDNMASTGLYYHAPAQVATTQSLAAQTGGTVTYNNGASGVGATLTLSVALTTLDGYSLVNGDRILVKNEVNQAYNGVYVWATGGTVLTRSTDTDSYGPGPGDLSENDYFFVQNGTVNKGNSYICATQGTIVFGTTAIVFSQFSTSQVYTAGTGLTLTGTQFSISNTAVSAASYGSASSVATFTVNAQGQLTAAATTPIAISNTQVSGLGTMSTQNANSVAITGGNIDGTTIGGTTPAAGTFTTLTANSTSQFGKSSANYQQMVGAATGLAPVHSVLGSDTNISLVQQSKGTGAIDLAAGSSGVNISNGGTVTAITRTATGSSYTGFPTVAITAPTTAGGVQATATPQLVAASTTVISGGTGYTVNDVLTVTTAGGSSPITITVTSVTGGVITAATANSSALTAIPSGTVNVSGGTGTGATFTLIYVIAATFTITNAGSGYVEQPTVSFSGGGGSGAAAYASVGATPTVKGLYGGVGQTAIQFAGPNGTILQLMEGGTAPSPTALVVKTGSTSAQLYPSASNAGLFLSSNGTGNVTFYTSTLATQQFAVSHTASAVNYVQVTGAATGSGVTISSQGSDASVNLGLQAKSGGVIRFFTGNGTENFRVASVSSTVNYLMASGAIAGATPFLSAQGTDTNIDLTLTPKGTGKVVLTNGLQGGSF